MYCVFPGGCAPALFASTVTVNVMEWVRPPPVAVAVTVAGATAASAAAWNVTDCDPFGVIFKLEGDAATPLGRPVKFTVTLSLKPFNPVTVRLVAIALV